MNICAELFTKNLEAKGLSFSTRVSDDGKDVLVDFPYQGKVVKCFFNGENGTYFSLYIVYENVPEDRVADLIFISNELNAKYKWVTFFVDQERDLMVHDDAILAVENAADEAFELLIRAIGISDEVKPIIMKGIYG